MRDHAWDERQHSKLSWKPGVGRRYSAPARVRYERCVNTLSERVADHEAQVRELQSRREALGSRANRISLFRLITFLAAVSALVTGLKQALPYALALSATLGLAFLAAVAWHARVLEQRWELEVRIEIHRRHLKRIAGNWQDLPSRGEGLLPADHPYASDIDLVGPGSLFQRIDVSQTSEGERALAEALGRPARPELVSARQRAVLELSQKPRFREEIEALGAARQQRGQKLDHAPFMALFALPPVFAARPWLKPLGIALLAATLTSVVLVQLDVVPGVVLWLHVFAQGALLWSLRAPVQRALDMLTARIGFAQAYQAMLLAIEREPFEAPHLCAVQRELRGEAQGSPSLRSRAPAGASTARRASESASVHMVRLARYEGFAQLRTQGPLYIVLNLLTLWDLLCLERIEHFVRTVGPRCEAWFRAVAEIELLCSLATLHHVDPEASFPELGKSPALSAQGLVHPLLPAATRVPNDVELPGPGTALIVTGSNMAGKSTLLRALGLNAALALAGGPVCARAFSLPEVRLRASMRIDDSLQRGASYFHAELTRLRMVVGDLDAGPPVLFLLDEVLRGTNAHARHQGARAVLLHLLERSALGLVATHDVALSALEQELPGRVHNVHFTDVFEDGEMRFDYKLREGVVKTSNALRLLALAGIEVPASDAVA